TAAGCKQKHHRDCQGAPTSSCAGSVLQQNSRHGSSSEGGYNGVPDESSVRAGLHLARCSCSLLARARHDMGTNARRDLDETGPNPAVTASRTPASNSAHSDHHDSPAAYTFLNVTLDMRRQLLVRGNEEIRLRPRSFDVLSYLVRNAGRLVGKQQLTDA